MELIGNKLTPSPGYKIYSQQSDTLHDVIYLGKYDSIDNYVEMKDPNAAPEEVEAISAIINATDKNVKTVVATDVLVDIANNIINK